MIILDISSITSAFTSAVTSAIKRLAGTNGAVEYDDDSKVKDGDRFEASSKQGVKLTEEKQEYFRAKLEQFSQEKAELILELLQKVDSGDSKGKREIRKQLEGITAKANICKQALGLAPGRLELPEEHQELHEAQLDELSQEKAGLILKLLRNTDNIDSKEKRRLRLELAKVEAKAVISKEALGLPAGRLELPEEHQKLFKAKLDELAQEKGEIMLRLEAAGNNDTAEKKDLRERLARIEAQAAPYKEALGLPPGKLELPEIFQETFRAKLEEASEEKADIILRLEAAGKDDIPDKQDLRAQLATIEAKAAIYKQSLGFSPGRLELPEIFQETFRARLEDISEEKGDILQRLLAAGNDDIADKQDLRAQLATIEAKAAIIRDALGIKNQE